MKEVHVLSLGAGVQSTTMLLMACHGEILPKLDLIVFADTKWEPKPVYRHLEWLRKEAAKHGHFVTISTGGDIRQDILDSVNDSKRFASLPFFTRNEDGSIGMVRRQCTNEYKIQVVKKATREFLGYKPGQRVKEKVIMWKGISTDEIERMADSQDKWIVNRYPLIEQRMNRLDCINWLSRKGYPIPPKSSCIGCPFHDDRMWLDMKRNDPESWNDAVYIDKVIKKLPRFKGDAYLHRSCKPLDEVDLNEDQMDMFDDQFLNECSGHCGV